MTPSEQSALQYRFSGYQLNLIQLDETGPSYAVIYEPHPYYINQPAYWQKPAYRGNTLNSAEIVGGSVRIDQSGNDSVRGDGPINLMNL